MYGNSGKKIIAMAEIFTVILIVASLIVGIGLWIIVKGLLGFCVGVVVMALGCTLAWMSNLLLAGFGEMVSNTHELLALANNALQTSTDAPVVIAPEKQAVSKTDPAETAPSLPETLSGPENNVVVAPIKQDDNSSIACPVCESLQKQGRNICFKCGAKFVTE